MTNNLDLKMHQYANNTTLLEVVDNPVTVINNIYRDIHTLSKGWSMESSTKTIHIYAYTTFWKP